MKETIQSLSLDYGDARFYLYQFQVPANTDSVPTHHAHRFYEWHLAHNGSHLYEINGQHIPLWPNQLLIIPPNVNHASVPMEVADYEYSVLAVSLTKIEGECGFYSFFEKVLNDYALSPINVPLSFSRRMAELSKKVSFPSIKENCYLKMQSSTLIYELFELLDRYHTAKEPHNSGVSIENRLTLLDTVINNPQCSLTDIAAAINYSPRHTARLIRTTYGCSLSELRKRRSKGE